MDKNQLFQADHELDRLATQTAFLATVEMPVIDRVSDGKKGLTVLDIGCNNGRKTRAFFSDERFSKIIGLEYNRELVDDARRLCRDERFSFAVCDVETPDFPRVLEEQMSLRGVKSFDVIYISLVLLHLREPFALLGKLRRYLSPDGHLVITEAYDAGSSIASETDRLVKEFVSMLGQDIYAGNRTVGAKLPEKLASLGYRDVVIGADRIDVKADDLAGKSALYDTFYSYFPEDVELLREADPSDPRYPQWAAWVSKNFEPLKQEILYGHFDVSMGVRVLSCKAPA